MRKIRGLIFLFLFALIPSCLFARLIKAEDIGCGANDVNCYTQKINEYQEKLKLLGQQSNTLSNQIAQFDAQIKLTSLKIAQVEEKITLLGGRIDQLEGSLNTLSGAFSSRAVETYKMARLGEPLMLLLSASDLSQVTSRFHYLEKIQEADRDLLQRLQLAQTTYKDEKSNQESLQNELQIQKKNLDTQKAAKANLLKVTKNDEKKYQQLLAQARAEYEAIQGIIAGRGVETEVGKVSESQKIASIIGGASCNSDGSHVHFIVSNNSETLNPFNYLKGGISFENCSGSGCGSNDGDPFNPSGSWNWPINPVVKFSQGYGSTWAIKNTWVGRVYNFHNGIDIYSSSSDVHAVKSGVLYRGSIATGSCRLRYVRVKHDEGGIDTYYLHVDY